MPVEEDYQADSPRRRRSALTAEHPNVILHRLHCRIKRGLQAATSIWAASSCCSALVRRHLKIPKILPDPWPDVSPPLSGICRVNRHMRSRSGLHLHQLASKRTGAASPPGNSMLMPCPLDRILCAYLRPVSTAAVMPTGLRLWLRAIPLNH
jgi:hypothetical protein